MKVLLIQPRALTSQGFIPPPFALLSVGEYARKNGHQIKIIDRNIEFNSFHKIKRFNPDIVGISVFTGPVIADAIKISKFVKAQIDAKVVWGGVHPTLLPEQTIKNDFIDYLILGEGEESFIEFLDGIENGKDLSKIEGLCFIHNGAIIKTEMRDFIEPLDKLPSTNYSLIKGKKYYRYEKIMYTSRGCPYNCGFCYNNEYNKRRWRAHSAQRVINEIKHLEKISKSKALVFFDDNFTVNFKRFKEIISSLSNDYSLSMEVRVEHITHEFLEAVKRFKEVKLFMGVESGVERLLTKINKRVTCAEIRAAFERASKYPNITTTASVILGLPTETEQERVETIKFAKSLKSSWISFFVYQPYPGSIFYKELVESGKFNPPEKLADWANFSADILDVRNSNIPELREIKRGILIKSLKNAFHQFLHLNFSRIFSVINFYRNSFLYKIYSLLGLD